MRDLFEVNVELAVLAGIRRVMKRDAIDPGQVVVDRLLDERIKIAKQERIQ